MSKTKALVYRNGDIIKKNEVLYYNGVKLDNVPYYKYLGVIMSTRGAQMYTTQLKGYITNFVNIN